MCGCAAGDKTLISPKLGKDGQAGLASPNVVSGSGSLMNSRELTRIPSLSLGKDLEAKDWRKTSQATGQDCGPLNGQQSTV